MQLKEGVRLWTPFFCWNNKLLVLGKMQGFYLGILGNGFPQVAGPHHGIQNNKLPFFGQLEIYIG